MRSSRRARLALACVSALFLSAFAASSADAVLGGSADGDAHPNVGMLLNDYQYSDGTWILCTGSLVSPTVFLTAAHCGSAGSTVTITFDPAYETGDQTHTGTFHADPEWGRSHADPHDIAVVVLDQPITDITPVTLPAAGSLDKLKQGTPVVGVGYGASSMQVGPGHDYGYTDIRNAATGTVNTVTPSWLKISENAAKGDGGGCFGDSGGPNFIDGVQVSITLSGDHNCRAINATYRLDTPDARAFLGQWGVDLP
jgi:hypothetical protein